MEDSSRNLDADLGTLIGMYGYKDVHTRLTEFMKDDFMFLRNIFDLPSKTTPVIQPAVQNENVMPILTRQKIKRKYEKKVKFEIPMTEPIVTPPITDVPEVKDIIVTSVVADKLYRDPKEVKAFQKAAEEAKARENSANGIQISDVLTSANLKKWIEEEGRTYAWVAREKSGCPETQVAATAQMMGVKSKISKKRGIIMAGK
jgi:hypothetical protein